MEKKKFKLLYGDWKPQCSTIDVEGNHCPEPVKKYIEFDEHRAIPICAKCLEALNQRTLIEGKANLINLLNNWKTKHELPNTELYDYNRGYVRAMNDVINELNRYNDSKRGQKTVFDRIRYWITEDWDK